jgi:xanthine dehydrogenase small subunit
MRTAVSRLELREPRSVRDALSMLRDEGPLTPLAGATDLYVALNDGTLVTGGANPGGMNPAPTTRFLNLWRLDALRRITVSGETLVIGALATYTAMIRSRAVRERLPMLESAARVIGGEQIQNRGTIGGNVANASPAGDTLPVLAVAEAVVVLRSAGQERRVPFNQFYTGYRQSVRRPDELITALEIPPVEGIQGFRKVGTRAAQAIAKVVMAVVRGPPGGMTARIALGSVAPTVIRLPRTEAALAAGADVEEAARVLEGEVDPIDDLRSTAAYRRRVAGNLLRGFWKITSPVS